MAKPTLGSALRLRALMQSEKPAVVSGRSSISRRRCTDPSFENLTLCKVPATQWCDPVMSPFYFPPDADNAIAVTRLQEETSNLMNINLALHRPTKQLLWWVTHGSHRKSCSQPFCWPCKTGLARSKSMVPYACMVQNLHS